MSVGVVIDGLGGGGNRAAAENRESSRRDMQGGLLQSQGLVAGEKVVSLVNTRFGAAGTRGLSRVEASRSGAVVLVNVDGSFLSNRGSRGGWASGGQRGGTPGHAAGGVQKLGIVVGLGSARAGTL